jgi:hypothetical protein
MRAWNGLIGDTELREIAARHGAGEDLRSIARERWRHWGYGSLKIARVSLAKGLAANGYTVDRTRAWNGAVSDAELRQIAARRKAGESLLSIGSQRYSDWGYRSAAAAARALSNGLTANGYSDSLQAWRGRIGARELRQSAARHQAGESLASIALGRWRDWGYSSPVTAAQALARGLRANGFAVRGSRAAARLLAKSGYATISATALREAAVEHEAGWSLKSIARRKYREWGYASIESASVSLGRTFVKAGIPVRSNLDAKRLHNTTHGTWRYRSPSHPKHELFLKTRRTAYAERRGPRKQHVRVGGQQILGWLEQNNGAKIAEIAAHFNISTTSAQRHANHLVGQRALRVEQGPRPAARRYWVKA